jgi:hypothetical protein
MRKHLKWKVFVLLAACVLFAACDGDDGINGLDGLAGRDGVDGKDGQSGAGLDDMLRDGNFELVLSGKFPSGVAFTDTVMGKYARTNYPQGSSHELQGKKDVFTLFRSETPFTAGAQVNLSVISPDSQVDYISVSFEIYPVTATGEYKSFNAATSLTAPALKDYKYDAATKTLTCKFTGKIPKDKVRVNRGSETCPEDIAVSGEINARLYEYNF